jgi:hypothetical protein
MNPEEKPQKRLQRRLNDSRESGADIDLTEERKLSLRQSVEIMNHLLNSPARPASTAALREILRARAEARMSSRPDKNSLPGLF